MEPDDVVKAAEASRELIELLAELDFRRVSEWVSVETVEKAETSRVVLRLSPADARTLLGLLRRGRSDEQPAWSG
jgi:hypothetical protein